MFIESPTYNIFRDELRRVSPQKFRPNWEMNEYSGATPTASAAGFLFFLHALGVGILVNLSLHVAIVIVVGSVPSPLLRNRRARIVALRVGRRPNGVVGSEPRNGTAAGKPQK
jgi:hypothetical protein